MSLVEVIKRPAETLSEITIPVDHTNGEDPPAGLVFASQSAVDAWFADRGVTAMKNLEAAWRATPNIVGHPITFELVSGVHRPPQAGRQGGFLLEGKSMSTNGVDVTVRGVLPSSWTVIQAAATVTGYSNSGNNPYLDFAASTFPNDGSLKGRFVSLDTGQVVIVHDHTDSRLEVIQQLSPAPTAGVTQATIVKPATIMRNSLDDIAGAGSIAGVYARNNGVRAFSPVAFENILFECYGAFYASLGDGQPTKYTYCHVDLPTEFAAHGLTAADYAGGMGGFGEYASNYNCSALGTKLISRTPSGPAFPFIQYGYAQNSYYNGFGTGNTASDRTLFQATSMVIANMQSRAVFLKYGCKFEVQDFFPGRRTTIRGGPGLRMESDAMIRAESSCKIWFEDVEGPCIQVGDDCHIVAGKSGPNFANGPLGGNDDVGIEFHPSAVGATVSLGNGTVTVNGSVGDVRMPDGSLVAWSSLASYGDFALDAATGARIVRSA